MSKPLYWIISGLSLVLLFYFSMDGGLWSIDSRDYENSAVEQDEDSLDYREKMYFSMRGMEVVTYDKVDGDWESETSDPIPYTFLTSLEIIEENDPNVSDMAKVMAWMFFYASIAQLFACISFFCSCYHHLKIQMEYDSLRLLANFSLAIVLILPLASGVYFFISFPNAVEADGSFFSNLDEDSNSFFGSVIGEGNFVTSWRPAAFYFVYIFLIPAIAVVNLIGYTPENLESYYSGSSGSEFGESFMEIPDHDDDSHVSFREAVGYGASTITYWIGYIFVVSLIGVIFSLSSVWLITKNTVTSWVLVSVFGFFYFILTFALVLAISYKYLSDIRLRGNQSLVSVFSSNTNYSKKASPLMPLAKPATLFFDKKEDDEVKVSCPECSHEIAVKSTGKKQQLKCPECGLEGEITV